MPLPFQWLVITDGTTDDAGIRNQVDLVSVSGFCLLADGDWRPATSEPKGGGVWRDSQLADGRRPADFKAQNVTEAMTLTVSALDQDALIRDTQNLRRLLNKARTYGTTQWQDEPVWIEAQSPGESEMRYSIIWNYSTPNDGNPYEEPFFQTVARAGMDDFVLSLEREPYWRADEPGTGTSTEIGVTQAYDGRTLGNVDDAGARVDTTAAEVFVANKQNVANLTDLYVDNGGAIGPNLMDAALPYSLLPAAPANGDIVYFGIDVAVADSGPFCSLVFDIGTAATYAGAAELDWEYWNGAWVALTIKDNTNGGTGSFDTTGVNSIHWIQPSDWIPVVVNVINAYWVRAVCDIPTPPGDAITTPTQQLRDVYSIVWPFVDINPVDAAGATQAGAVLGDVAAVTQLEFRNWSDNLGVGVALNLYANRVIVGLRSYDRGANFAAYINLCLEQNHADVTIVAGANTTIPVDTTTATGMGAIYNPLALEALATRIRVQIADPTAWDYNGTFHMFLRARQSGGAAGDITVRILMGLGSNQVTYTSSTQVFANVNEWQLLDFGQITIPQGPFLASDRFTEVRFQIQASSTDGVANMYLYELILIPVDEWAGDFVDTSNETGTPIIEDAYLSVNSLIPKFDLRSVVWLVPAGGPSTVADRIRSVWLPISAGPVILQSNARQRLWFLTLRTASAGSADWRCEPYIGSALQVTTNKRYLSMRGDR